MSGGKPTLWQRRSLEPLSPISFNVQSPQNGAVGRTHRRSRHTTGAKKSMQRTTSPAPKDRTAAIKKAKLAMQKKKATKRTVPSPAGDGCSPSRRLASLAVVERRQATPPRPPAKVAPTNQGDNNQKATPKRKLATPKGQVPSKPTPEKSPTRKQNPSGRRQTPPRKIHLATRRGSEKEEKFTMTSPKPLLHSPESSGDHAKSASEMKRKKMIEMAAKARRRAQKPPQLTPPKHLNRCLSPARWKLVSKYGNVDNRSGDRAIASQPIEPPPPPPSTARPSPRNSRQRALELHRQNKSQINQTMAKKGAHSVSVSPMRPPTAALSTAAKATPNVASARGRALEMHRNRARSASVDPEPTSALIEEMERLANINRTGRLSPKREVDSSAVRSPKLSPKLQRIVDRSPKRSSKMSGNKQMFAKSPMNDGSPPREQMTMRDRALRQRRKAQMASEGAQRSRSVPRSWANADRELGQGAASHDDWGTADVTRSCGVAEPNGRVGEMTPRSKAQEWRRKKAREVLARRNRVG